jgi:hypothetical protein
LEVDGAGNAVLPKIKTKNTPSETLRQLLKGYATFTHPGLYIHVNNFVDGV